MKSKWNTIGVACLAAGGWGAIPSAASADETRFDWPDGLFTLRAFSSKKITPSLRVGKRQIAFAYGAYGRLQREDRSSLVFTAGETNVFTRLERTKDGVRADWVLPLVGDRETNPVVVGLISNSIEAVAASAHVTATIYPACPGKYRFGSRDCVQQVIVFMGGYTNVWVGGIVDMEDDRKNFHMNRLPSHEEYNPETWRINDYQVGPQRFVHIGFVPDVWTFNPGPKASVGVNRYRGGFEMNFFCPNPDPMHKPAWTGPLTFDYTIKVDR